MRSDRERKRETEFKICSADMLLPVKIMFEEVGFRASFQDNEGRVVTDSERKRIVDSCSREAKGTTTILFSFQGGDAESSVIRRRMQRPRMDIDMDAISQALRGSASDDLIAETSYFVFNSLSYGELVQLLEKRYGVIYTLSST